MKATVLRVVILLLAPGAHLEVSHGCQWPVIGDIFDYGKARPAVSAVGKWIAVAPVLRVQSLTKTWPAGGDIRGDELIFTRLRLALSNLEALVTGSGKCVGIHVLDVHHGGRLAPQAVEKRLQRLFFALKLDLNTARGVAHPSFEAPSSGQLIDKWPEADPLDDATHLH